MRQYLVFCSSNNGRVEPELFGEDRLFDVALHDYGNWPANKQTAGLPEYYYAAPGVEKFKAAAALVPGLPIYDFFAFLDDDLWISTAELNRLFQAGSGLSLPLFQPALTCGSFGSHQHLFQMRANSQPFIRSVPFVEIMCPVFRIDTLLDCLPSFDLNESGWGLDCYYWPTKTSSYVIDSIPIGHYRQPSRRDRKLKNGLTPMQELWIMKKIFDPTDDSLPPA